MYKPTCPLHIKEMMAEYNKKKLPHFFIYAKDKKIQQVEKSNNSCVNRIKNIIPKSKFNFNTKTLGKFDYRILMKNTNVDLNNDISKNIIKTFSKNSKKINNYKNIDDGHNNYGYLFQQLIEELLHIYDDKIYITDVLVKQLFYINKSKHKLVFWECFGDIVVENIKSNLKENTIMCEKCGKRIYRDHPSRKFCDKCAKYQPMQTKTIICQDCGKKIEIDARDMKTKRCKNCQHEVDKKNKRDYYYRNINKI